MVSAHRCEHHRTRDSRHPVIERLPAHDHLFPLDGWLVGHAGSLRRLRHTFCAHLVTAGVPLRRVQLLAGHSDYKVTERYAHLAPGGAASAVSKLKF